jgi:glycosyltransferase involved in cell wall biosynthesis
MNIKLSVIIPTCNRPSTLIRAVNSVVSQGIDSLEIIVVDDSSNDTTCNALVSYVHSGQLRYFKNVVPRSGPAFSRNFGVGMATGEFVAFLDDDDVYLQGRLSKMLALAKDGAYVFISTGRFYESDDFNYIKNVPGQCFGVITLDHIKYGNDIDIGFMLKRSVFLKLGGFDTSFKNLEDWDFVLRMLMTGDGFKHQRLDYAVNINANRPRVSADDYIGYLQLADKYQRFFGDEWYVFMQATSAMLKGTLSPELALRLTCSGRSLAPIKIMIKARLVSLKKLHRVYRKLLDTE